MIETNEVKKILIKCPYGSAEQFLIIPFVTIISEEFPKAEINLICEEKDSDAYNYLPFKVKSFERPKEKQKFLGTHQFCANLHDVFNIDLFFDLENSVNSAFLGYNFRAKVRVGYEKKWNKYFLTHKFQEPLSLSNEKKYIRLLELYLNKKFDDVRVQRSRIGGSEVSNVEKLFKEPEPPKFIMVMLDDFKNVSSQIEIWKSFFDSFHGQKFVIWSMEDQHIISETFAKIDINNNELYMHEGTKPEEVVYLFSKVKGVVANNLWCEALCNYFGMDSVSLLDAITKFPDYEYYKFKPQRMIFHAPNLIKHSYLDEEKEYFEINQIVDHIHFQFKL